MAAPQQAPSALLHPLPYCTVCQCYVTLLVLMLYMPLFVLLCAAMCACVCCAAAADGNKHIGLKFDRVK